MSGGTESEVQARWGFKDSGASAGLYRGNVRVTLGLYWDSAKWGLGFPRV